MPIFSTSINSATKLAEFDSNTEVVVTTAGHLAVTNIAFHGFGNNNLISVAGSVTTVDGNALRIEFGNNNLLRNSGSIHTVAACPAVLFLSNGNRVINTGTITKDGPSGSDPTLFFGGQNNRLDNAGLIEAFGSSAVAITGSLTGQTNTIANSGTIRASETDRPVIVVAELNAGNTIITNTGTIQGDVKLGVGQDVFNSAAGTFIGIVFGAAGNDALFGGHLGEGLDGGADNDVIDGGGGIDTMTGGAGNDLIRVDNAADVVVELANGGADVVEASVSYALAGHVETLVGIGGGALVLIGNADGNTIRANNAGNRLIGGAGADALVGGAGNDVFVFDGADSITDTAGGFDTVETAVSFTNVAAVEAVVALGNAAIALAGSANADSLTGNAAANSLAGDAGDDRLGGRDGKDILRGGAGKDAFVFDTKPSKSTNIDRVLDFNVKDDTIHLDNAVMKALGKAGRLSSDAFVKSGTALDKQDRVLYDSKSGALFYDGDGTGGSAKIQIAIVSKNLKMTSADFLVI